MMLLDSTYLTDYVREVPEVPRDNLIDLPAVSVVTYHEVMTGVKYFKTRREEEFFNDFFSRIDILDYTMQAAKESSTLAARLKGIGKPVNPLDTMIAGTANAHDAAALITEDKDFLEIGKVSWLSSHSIE
jgi:predicted nucleic acid-binding protein